MHFANGICVLDNALICRVKTAGSERPIDCGFMENGSGRNYLE